MVMTRFVQRLRSTGTNPALQDGRYSQGFGPIRFVSGPDYWPTRSKSGTIVTEEVALGQTALYRCVVLISTTAGGQPIHVYGVNEKGERERFENDANAFLWDRPNPEMTNQTYFETVIGHEVMGDAFIFVVKNNRGAPLELWYVEPWRVKTGRTNNGLKIYEVDDGEYVLFDYAEGGEIIHVPNWGRDPLRGMNPIKVATSAIALGISAQEYAERFFSQDSTPRGLLSTDMVLSKEQANDLKKEWDEKHGGNRSGGTAVLGSGAKFQAISVNPEDAQLLEERKFSNAQYAQLFGVPPHMIGEVDRSTSWGAGIEEQTRGFLTFTLQAHINRFEQAINYALLKRRETSHYVKFDMTGLLRPNSLQMAQLHGLGYGRWLTPNDIRRDLDLPPVEGGDDLLAALNLVPIEQLGSDKPSGDDTGEAAGPNVSLETEVQQLALNGAQITALLELVTQVTLGQLSPDTARALMRVGFPALSDAEIEKLVASAAGFEPRGAQE